jgi:hypothetical protein
MSSIDYAIAIEVNCPDGGGGRRRRRRRRCYCCLLLMLLLVLLHAKQGRGNKLTTTEACRSEC